MTPTPLRAGAVLGTALLVLAAAGCDFFSSSSPSSCTQSIQPGIVVTVVDSVTGAFIADSASGNIYSPAFADTLSVGYPGQTLEGAWERTGNFRVTVSRPGYNDWIQAGIVVTKDVCHVQTQRITARMQK